MVVVLSRNYEETSKRVGESMTKMIAHVDHQGKRSPHLNGTTRITTNVRNELESEHANNERK